MRHLRWVGFGVLALYPAMVGYSFGLWIADGKVGGLTIADGLLEKYQTLVTGLIALGVGWATVSRLNLQIKEARDAADSTRRATIAGQNHDIIAEVDRLNGAVFQFKQHIANAPAYLVTESGTLAAANQRVFGETVKDNPVATGQILSIFVDRIFALDAARAAFLDKVERFRFERTRGAKEDDALAMQLDATHAADRLRDVLHDLAELLGKGFTVAELSSLSADDLRILVKGGQ